MGAVTNICKDDKRAPVNKAEVLSTKSPEDLGLDSPINKGKSGKNELSFKEDSGNAQPQDNTNADKVNEFSMYSQNKVEENRQEASSAFHKQSVSYFENNNSNLFGNQSHNGSQMINNSFTHSNFINREPDNSENPMQGLSIQEREKMKNEYISNYRTNILMLAEQKAGKFNKDNYQHYRVDPQIIQKITAPSLQLKDDIFSVDEENHCIYFGQRNKRHQKHGFGTMITNTGEKYEGYWENDVFKPYGRYINLKGEIYEGGFDNGLLHGRGKIIYLDGKFYDGDLFYGQKNGIGIESSESETYQGQFKNNLRDGKGHLKYLLSGNEYNGDFKDGRLTGTGEYTWKTGDKYIGSIINGVFEGKGTYLWTSGERYEGNYEKGVRKGLGMFTWKDGRIYKGEFDNNKPHGNGIIIDKGLEKRVLFNEGAIVRTEKKKLTVDPHQQIMASAQQQTNFQNNPTNAVGTVIVDK